MEEPGWIFRKIYHTIYLIAGMIVVGEKLISFAEEIEGTLK